jgi:hypothetical protein
MKRQSLVFACALAAAALSTAVGRASTIDDAATRVVVPYVAWDGTTDTTVFVTNHESRDVKVNVIYVGESTGPAPGRRTCNSVLLPAAQLSRIDVLTACGLTRPTGAGMVVLVEDDAGIARLSARARVGIFSPVSGSPLQVLTVQGLPLSALDTTDNVHAAYGLRQVPAPAPAVITDCFFGTFTDASGAGGALVNFALVDAAGHTLGSKVFAVRPFELVSVPHVFKALGGTGDHEGARMEFRLAGGGDAVVGYCLAAQEGTNGGDRTVAMELAQVDNPVDETRRREFSAVGGPGVGAFVMLTSATSNLHGIYVRHLDRVTCSVSTPVPDAAFFISALSPDRAQTIGGSSNTTGEFGGPGHGAVAGGQNELWGLTVTFNGTPPAAYLHVPYRIDCMSGNGTSLADRVL